MNVYDTLGCPKPGKDTVMVNVDRIRVDAGPADTSIVIGQPLQLFAAGNGTSFNWTPSRWLNSDTLQNPVSLAQDNITYVVTAFNAAGCSASDTIRVAVFKTVADLYIPDAFTPNGDGLNDDFKPIALGISKLHYFRVYNRYGEVVFSTSRIGDGWDGKHKGLAQPTACLLYTSPSPRD